MVFRQPICKRAVSLLLRSPAGGRQKAPAQLARPTISGQPQCHVCASGEWTELSSAPSTSTSIATLSLHPLFLTHSLIPSLPASITAHRRGPHLCPCLFASYRSTILPLREGCLVNVHDGRDEAVARCNLIMVTGLVALPSLWFDRGRDLLPLVIAGFDQLVSRAHPGLFPAAVFYHQDSTLSQPRFLLDYLSASS
ncbi:hypothetical protein EVG20_g6802 [Dentipellis fragilis]|uniref:Uncharacterized protein n=1 Tax=Dentipellis fragilis TaxID=205917 RepID=A0A4Y9YKD3_9AGAM|nr:hypothetical protein EVG20_g6802 [Dentipellis fragilis]